MRDRDGIAAALLALRPQTILHLAAQPIVRRSYAEPVETYATNVMGAVHLLDAARACPALECIVVVTSDKVYADHPHDGGYAEDARLGGSEPYAGSKAAAELVVETYRRAFFSGPGAPRIVTARAGNVIGGGDFSADRLLPDAYRAFAAGSIVTLRHPAAIRPWQHVLDPLHGYLRIVEAAAAGGAGFGAYNFGPDRTADVRSVVERFGHTLGAGAPYAIRVEASPEHETAVLAVDSARAHADLGWRPRWATATAVDAAAAWYRDFHAGEPVQRLVERDLDAYAG